MMAPRPKSWIRWLPTIALILTLLDAILWLVVALAAPEDAVAVLFALLALFYAGKEAGIPLGLHLGVDPATMALFIVLTDVAFTLFLYPLVHFAIDSWMLKTGWLGVSIRYIRERAERYRGFLNRTGPPGLFLFMLVPFIFNGPLVGAVLGRLVGLSARKIVPVLVLAIVTTTLAWTLIYAFGLAEAKQVHPSLPFYIVATIILFLLARATYTLWRARRAEVERRHGAPPP